MIDRANMQGVMNVIRQAELANSQAADASLRISNEQQQSRFASDLLEAIRTVNATQMQSAETKTNFEARGDVSVTDVLIDSQRASVATDARCESISTSVTLTSPRASKFVFVSADCICVAFTVRMASKRSEAKRDCCCSLLIRREASAA